MEAAKMRTARACSNCKLAHTACDSNRPCSRCAALGKEDSCVDVERKKRGRPKNLGTNGVEINGGEHHPKIKSEPASGGSYYQQEAKRPRADGSAFQMGSRYGGSGGAGGIFAAAFPLEQQYQAAGHSRPSPTSSPSYSSSSSSPTSYFAGARTATPPSSLGPFADHGAESDRSGSGAGGGSSAMLESVLSLLVEEVKELRHATQQLREEHMLLANEVAALQQRQTERDAAERDRTAHPGSANLSPSSDTSSPFSALNAGFSSTSSGYPSAARSRPSYHQPMLSRTDFPTTTTTTTATAGSTSPPSSNTFAPQHYIPPTTSTYHTSASNTLARGPGAQLFVSTVPPPRSTAYARREVINYLPFLSKYPISSPDSPFAIDDLSKPFAAVRRVTGVPGEWEYSPPIFVFANDAFCAMVKYPLNELLGCPLSKVMFPDEQIKRKMSPFISQKTAYPLSDLILHSALCVTKDGKLFRFPSKYQICYSENGQARWGIICGTGEDIEPVTFETNIPAAASAASFFARERDDPTVLENLQWGAVDWASNATSSHQVGGFLTAPIGDGALASRGSKLNTLLAGTTGTARITELDSTDAAAGERMGDDSRGSADADIDLLSFPLPLPSPLGAGSASGDFSWLLRDNPLPSNDRQSGNTRGNPNTNTKWQ